MSAARQPVLRPQWFKSSYSGGNATECVECAHSARGALIRDSKRAEGPVVRVRAGAWSAFVGSLSRNPPG
ncbi:DUF397 domain-containing protein [Streptomyces prasinopilosus]|uniref:DUF397 domain-containing protein n=1 Tax=Streptomyces prasinopilosus TaxID=67344 RepID=A0A1G6I8T8_9ACTN|nr:DUF397 domain-containing protein [Streptomyces prasinopilosus]SDC02850.1 protein of unknown function [Streptomyces prasinopilosus]